LLISDIDSEKVTLNLIGSSQTSSTQFQGLISTASTKKDARLTEIAESEKRLAEAKAAAELKAKQDAEAKAAAELKAKAAADLKAQQEAAAKAAATKKKTTITCVKGKTTKKVTAVSPKCPSGFKKK
jgi:membrane protein involved in colicin uptake